MDENTGTDTLNMSDTNKDKLTNTEHDVTTNTSNVKCEKAANVDILEKEFDIAKEIPKVESNSNSEPPVCSGDNETQGGATEERLSDSDSDDGFQDALDEIIKDHEASLGMTDMDKMQDRTEHDDDTFEEFEHESNQEGETEAENVNTGEQIIIDEVALQELEASMTDEQKLERKNEAQELKTKGNELFKTGELKEASEIYTEALKICLLCFKKERSIMYSNRAACRLHLDNNEGAIADCTKAVELNPNYLKALLRRAELYEKTEKLDEALADYQRVVEMDPSQHSARQACMRLPDQINKRNEKLKEEMLGKLKDLGNMVLRPFGLSTDNFKLNQDPNSGGYSVNFQQNQQK